MFREFFIREIKGGLKAPMIWIFFFIMALLAFGATSSSNVQIGGSIGNVHKNAPFVIIQFVSVLSLFGILIAAAFYNKAALKDFNANFNEILFSSPIKKAGYFMGRFTGALFLATIPLLGTYLGVVIGSFVGPAAGWIEPEQVGPFYGSAFISGFVLFILPNMFIAGTIIFGLANKFKSTTVSFVGALVILVGYIISTSLMSDIENETLAAMTDPFGLIAYDVDSRYFTPVEKNTLSPGFSGWLFINRLIWTGVGFAILLLSYFTFSFRTGNKKVRKKKSEKAQEVVRIGNEPSYTMEFEKGYLWQQFRSFFSSSFRSVFKSNSFRILFIFNAILLLVGIFDQYEYYGLQSYPITYKMNDLVSGSANLFLVIILVFFSGELIWRDRNSQIHEVVDSTPHHSFVSLLAKSTALIALVTLIYAFSVVVVIINQLLNGYTNLELGIYALSFLYEELPVYAVWALFMLFYSR